MSFRDEVLAHRRNQISLPLEQESQALNLARDVANSEIAELWNSAKEFWESDNLVQPGFRDWARDGGTFDLYEDAELVPLDIPLVSTFTRSRLLPIRNTDNLEIAVQQTVPGFRIQEWFSLTKPGEIRECVAEIGPLHPRLSPAEGMLAATLLAYNSRFVQVEPAKPRFDPADQERSHFEIMKFAGPKNEEISIRCDIRGPVEVHQMSQSGWIKVGTLRELVVAALAK